ncbi:MAG TPA: endolytic transglycosylase MltG [Bryobacteraceae bacterium]|nr:endolytic transglycosylase MltG [Bryobacteraceae bacterium]
MKSRFAVVLLAAGLLGCSLYSLYSPYRGFDRELFVQISKGSGTWAIGQKLADAGVVRYSWQFWLARAIHPRTTLQAGEYRFEQPASVAEVFSRLGRGDVYYFSFTVPEGSNMFDIAKLLDAEGIMPGQDFLKAAETLEGFLFPSTYRLTHATTPAALCQMMTAQFHKEWKKLMPKETAEVPVTDMVKVVTLASLIEKETGVAKERPLVASVFQNRLRLGMALDCDPTVIYAALLESRYRGTIHRSDLDNKNPYNTYQHAGLPPGPIANPGTSSLAAALHPAETEFLYFVAKPGGDGHVFSSSLAAHNKAVGSYRRASERKARKAR